MKILQTLPTDLRVVVNGYEDGYDYLSSKQVSVVKIALNAGKQRMPRTKWSDMARYKLLCHVMP